MSAAKVSCALAALLACTSTVQAEDIYHAAAVDDLKQVETLLREYPELLDTPHGVDNTTPLMTAASAGSEAVVHCLLDKGANWKATNRAKETALHRAVKSMAFYLTGADVGRPERYRAMWERYQHVVLLLLAKGADINGRDASVRTPLQSVASEGEPEIGVLKDKYTPHDIARLAKSSSYRVQVADFLIAHGAVVDIFSAAGLDKVDHAVRLLDRDPNLVNEHDFHGDTALHWAARLNRAGVARLLLVRGANVDDVAVPLGMTPLAEAALAGNRQVVEVLLENGADVNAPSGGNRRPPLHWAVGNDHADVVEVLLAHGANMELKDGNGDTPLLLTAGAGDKYAVDLLLKHGANLEAANGCGRTPLFLAVASGKRVVAEALLAAGANITPKDCRGKTPLQYAEEHGDKDLVELLHQHGVKE